MDFGYRARGEYIILCPAAKGDDFAAERHESAAAALRGHVTSHGRDLFPRHAPRVKPVQVVELAVF